MLAACRRPQSRLARRAFLEATRARARASAAGPRRGAGIAAHMIYRFSLRFTKDAPRRFWLMRLLLQF